jgi:hypothetical protein
VARSHLLSSLQSSGLLSRSFASGSNGNGKHSSVYITDTDGNVAANTPLLLGLVNYFEVGDQVLLLLLHFNKQQAGQPHCLFAFTVHTPGMQLVTWNLTA